MKFSCTQENLRQGLSIVSHIANRNINLPILENVLIKAEDSGLKLMTTNLEIAVSCVIRGKVETKGEFTAPSKLLSDYISLLPHERVDIEQTNNSLTVSCGNYQTRLHGIVASEFPLIPPIEGEKKFSIKVSDLRQAINQVIFAVAANESRPEISGVLFKFLPQNNGLSLILAATDSYRLAEKIVLVNKENSSVISEPISVIVPTRAVAEVVRILGVFRENVDSSETTEIVIAENQIVFNYNDAQLISRTIEGRYPDYRQLIPNQFETEAVIPKEELLRAIKTTSLFSRAGLNDVHLKITPELPVKITANNPQTGEHSVGVESEVKGKENEITVNYRYLIDGVNNIESGRIKIQLNNSLNPCMLRSNSNEPDYLYIVMPIRQ